MQPHPAQTEKPLTPRQVIALEANRPIHRNSWRASLSDLTAAQRNDMQRQEPPNHRVNGTLNLQGK